MRALRLPLVCALSLAGALSTGTGREAQALPPAGTDRLPVLVTIDIASRLGQETIVLTGRAEIDRDAPVIEGGVEVVDLEIVDLDLVGASQVGAVSAAERPNQGSDYVSSGEVRSLQSGQDFPASSSFDLYVNVAVPHSKSPTGPLTTLVIHNEEPLHLTLPEAGQGVVLTAWPPLGVVYELEPIFGVDNDGDGLIDEDTLDDDGDGFVDPGPHDNDGDGLFDEDPDCIPLFEPGGSHFKAGYCLRDVTVEIAPELPSYSVARGGPSGLHPVDIFALTPDVSGEEGQAPFVRIACADLGLSADGCDDGSDGDQDDLNALSYGGDFATGTSTRVGFSVGPGAQGAPGSAVEEQRNCPPAYPGLSPEPEPDVFSTLLKGTNGHTLDGNGPVGTCPSAFPLGLTESATVRDDLDALYGQDSSVVDGDADGVPEGPVYLSLDEDSPSLTALGFSAADVLKTVGGGAPTVYASYGALGLKEGDDLDALCLQESGDGAYAEGDVLYFSLAAGSPTLSQIGAGPGDLLAPGVQPSVVWGAAALGLLGSDDVNALDCRSVKDAGGDVDGDTIPNGTDPDDDNDGCADKEELGSNPSLGGRRNPHSFWDFFDAPNPNRTPQRDRMIRISDVIWVLFRYGADDEDGTAPINRNTDPLSTPPKTGYHPAYDRGGVAGPDVWNLAPADGVIRIGDIVSVLNQYGDECTGA